MDFIQTILFESPIWLGVGCFFLFAIVLLARGRMSERARAWSLPGVLLLTVGLFVLQWAVQTDRERIWSALDDFVAAIAAKDQAAIDQAIGDAYASEGMGHRAMVGFINDCLSRVDVFDTRLRQRDVTVTDDHAELALGAIATVRVRGGAGEMHMGHWRLDWAKEGDRWRIVAIRPIDIDTVHVENLHWLAEQIR